MGVDVLSVDSINHGASQGTSHATSPALLWDVHLKSSRSFGALAKEQLHSIFMRTLLRCQARRLNGSTASRLAKDNLKAQK